MNSPRQVVWMVGLSGMVSLLYLIGSAQTPSRLVPRFAHVVDLTHALDEQTPYIPVPNITFPFRKTPIATVARNGVAAYRWEIHEHLGTQIDAPNHFFEHGVSLERCEEYRAAATSDRAHDEVDRRAARVIKCPVLALWSEGGPLDVWYQDVGGPLGILKQWAPHVRGRPVRGGHFFPEQNPGETVTALRESML